jgi:hypothetical protein
MRVVRDLACRERLLPTSNPSYLPTAHSRLVESVERIVELAQLESELRVDAGLATRDSECACLGSRGPPTDNPGNGDPVDFPRDFPRDAVGLYPPICLQRDLRPLYGPCSESSPHFRQALTSQDPEKFADDGLLSKHVLEVLHDGEQPFVRHVGDGRMVFDKSFFVVMVAWPDGAASFSRVMVSGRLLHSSIRIDVWPRSTAVWTR